MANDFSGSNACALWTLDDSSGLVLTDSIGSNDLTDFNTVGQDTSDYKEGNGCADFDRASEEVLYSNDVDLDANFPGKNGVAEQDMSICFWLQFETLPGATKAYGVVAKSNDGQSAWSYVVYVDGNNADKFTFLTGDGGANYDTLVFGTAPTTGVWYHVGVTYTASDNSRKVRVWDDNAGALLGSNASDTSAHNMGGCDDVFALGYIGQNLVYCLDGQLDEVVVIAGEALSDADIDKIRAGTYGAAAGVAPTAAFYGPLVGPLGGPI